MIYMQVYQMWRNEYTRFLTRLVYGAPEAEDTESPDELSNSELDGCETDEASGDEDTYHDVSIRSDDQSLSTHASPGIELGVCENQNNVDVDLLAEPVVGAAAESTQIPSSSNQLRKDGTAITESLMSFELLAEQSTRHGAGLPDNEGFGDERDATEGLPGDSSVPVQVIESTLTECIAVGDGAHGAPVSDVQYFDDHDRHCSDDRDRQISERQSIMVTSPSPLQREDPSLDGMHSEEMTQGLANPSNTRTKTPSFTQDHIEERNRSYHNPDHPWPASLHVNIGQLPSSHTHTKQFQSASSLRCSVRNTGNTEEYSHRQKDEHLGPVLRPIWGESLTLCLPKSPETDCDQDDLFPFQADNPNFGGNDLYEGYTSYDYVPSMPLDFRDKHKPRTPEEKYISHDNALQNAILQLQRAPENIGENLADDQVLIEVNEALKHIKEIFSNTKGCLDTFYSQMESRSGSPMTRSSASWDGTWPSRCFEQHYDINSGNLLDRDQQVPATGAQSQEHTQYQGHVSDSNGAGTSENICAANFQNEQSMDNINQADASHANSSLGFIDNDYHTEAPSASSQEWVTQGAASQEGVTHDSQAAPPLQTLDHWVDVSRGDFPASMRVSSVDAEVQTEPLSELTQSKDSDPAQGLIPLPTTIDDKLTPENSVTGAVVTRGPSTSPDCSSPVSGESDMLAQAPLPATTADHLQPDSSITLSVESETLRAMVSTTLKRQDSVVKEKEKEISQLKKNCITYKTEIESLHTQINGLNDVLEKKDRSIQEFEERTRQLSEENAQLQNSCRGQEAMNEEKTHLLREQADEIEALRRVLSSLNEELNDSNTKNSDLENANKSMEAANTLIQADVSRLQGEKESMRTQIEDLTREKTILSDEKTTLFNKVAQLQGEKKTLEDKHKCLKDELKALLPPSTSGGDTG